ncbi:MAG: response regulator [Gemmatimonadota bacterium]|nr:MAG: response regulator [Gemmatimonadota bacterium]
MTHRKSILVVDNYRNVREVLGQALRRWGHEVRLASSGEEACEILQHTSVDTILMDLRMPAMSGQMLYHVMISQWPELRYRVIVMTADPEAPDHEPWLRLYRLPVLSKPFTLDEVSALIEAVSASEPREANGEF